MRLDHAKRRGHGLTLPFLLALGVHILLFSVLLLNLSFSSKPLGAKKNLPSEPIVHAKAVDEQKIQKVMKQIEEEKEKKKQEEIDRKQELQKLEQQRKEEEKRLKELKSKKELEKKKLSELQKKKKFEEKKRKIEEKKRKEKAKKEALKKKKEAERKKKELEKKKKAEAKKKREAEKKRKAAEAKKKRQELERRADAEFNRYAARIQAKVENNWRYAGQQCHTAKVLVKLAPGGVVRNVRVIRGSGDPVFDRSVEAAFLRASPLPLPPDPQLFEFYREIEFVFNPCG